MDDLSELAARWGVDLGYFDARGSLQRADPEAVLSILAEVSRSYRVDAPPGDGPAKALGWRPAYQGDGDSRHWLLAVQLYALRSQTNWGHGDFTDLTALLLVAAEAGAAGIGLNPLHALFVERPEQASPYSPNSRLFLNPLYIDVTAAPGFPGVSEAGLTDAVEALCRADMVDYSGVARAKMHALRLAHGRFRDLNLSRDDFAAFRHERGPALTRFAVFETLRRTLAAAWWEWPEEWRRPTDQVLQVVRERHREEVEFEEYVQWVADRQLRQCRDLAARLGLPVGLYIDLAIGVDPAGADGWAEQAAYLNNLSVGAPPDLLNTAGQDWGLATFNPHRLIASGFEPWRELLAAAMRYAGAIRIDHILGLNRMYVIPRGWRATQGTYLRFPFEAMLSVIGQESMRHRCIVIGEDLGTVPEGFRQTLTDWGVWTYLVVLFERDHEGRFRDPGQYPKNGLATFSTHDLAPFVGWMSGQDMATKRDIGIDPGETDDERAWARRALFDLLARYGRDQDAYLSVVRHLAETPTRLVSVSIEDIMGVGEQINVPGTVDQHPNWRRRLPRDIEGLRCDARMRQVAEVFAQAGRTAKAGS